MDPYAENFDPAIGEEVELMLVAACQGVSQKTGSVSTQQVDHTPKDVTRRQRSRPKRAVTMGEHHGAPDLPAPLPKRELRRSRTKANFTCPNARSDAKVLATSVGSARNFTLSTQS